MRHACRPAALSLCVVLLAVPHGASAQLENDASIPWTSNGIRICSDAHPQHGAVIVAAGRDNALVAWLDARSGLNVYGQRVTSYGSVYNSWPLDGMSYGQGTGASLVMAPDQFGGAFIATDQPSLYRTFSLLHIKTMSWGASSVEPVVIESAPVAGGAPDASEPEKPRPGPPPPLVGTHEPTLVAESPGTVLAAWIGTVKYENQDPVQYVVVGRIVRPSEGIGVSGPVASDATLSMRGPVVCPDGAGGALVAWIQGRRVMAMRVRPDLTADPRWPAGGRDIGGAPAMDGAPAIVPDTHGGAFVVWQDQRMGVGIESPCMQHILGDGSLDAAWPDEGRMLSKGMGAAGEARSVYARVVRYSRAVADGAGGVLVAWTEYARGARFGAGDIRAQRVLPDGAAAPGWPEGGVAVCLAGGEQRAPVIVPDGVGGAFVAWQDARRGEDWDIYAQHIEAAGRVAPGWGASGVALCSAPGDQMEPIMTEDGPGAAYVAWTDLRTGVANVYAARVVSNFITSALAARGDGASRTEAERAAPAAIGLALRGFTPNPASADLRVALTLPDAEPATLELLDIAGKRMLRRHLVDLGPGPHVVPLGVETSLPPGVYLLRLTQGARSVSVKSSILR